MTDVTAQLNGLRISPRKVRAVVGLLKKKDVQAALDQLSHFTRRSVPALAKLIESAVASATTTYKLDRKDLYIKEMTVDEGIKLKRYMPKGFGRAGEIQKKTSRIKLVLSVRQPKPVKAAAAAPVEAVVVEEKAPAKKRAVRKTKTT